MLMPTPLSVVVEMQSNSPICSDGNKNKGEGKDQKRGERNDGTAAYAGI